MIITVASFKGGVGKTATAVHLAGCFNATAPALLIDGDPNRSATDCSKRGSLPFKVVNERQAARHVRDFDNNSPTATEPIVAIVYTTTARRWSSTTSILMSLIVAYIVKY